MQQAVFGAGCFWGVETAFAAMPGVIETAVGYSGGKLTNPTYQQVCTDRSGHAEVVQVTYDPAKISFETLIEQFFMLHDPTQLNRQGPDIGTQYRSVIFVENAEEEAVARQVIAKAQASGYFKKPIVTTIEPTQTFWRAEEYHQKYFEKRGGGSCHI